MPDAPLDFDLAVRSEIVIHAPSSTVWSYLNRAQEWKDSVASIERIAGTCDEEGEVLRVGQRAGTQTVHTVLTTLGLKLDQWKIQSLITEDGRIPTGYVINSLYARDGGTLLVCELVARCQLAAVETQGRSIGQVAQTIREATQAKLDADLCALKTLAEGA